MDKEILKSVIEKTGTSVRSVWSTLFVLTFASLLALTSFFNALDVGWVSTRASLRSQFTEWCKTEPTEAEVSVNGRLDSWYQLFKSQKRYDPRYCEKINEGANQFWDESRSKTLYTIDVSQLGIKIDLNDLAFFSGIVLMLIMLTLKYKMILRHQNLSNSIILIKQQRTIEEQRDYFRLLSTSQIIGRPSAKDQTEISRMLKFIFRTLVSLPVVVHGLILFIDFDSWGVLLRINFQYVVFTTIAAGILLVILLFQTVGCYRVETQTDRLWEGVIKDLFGDKN